MSPQHYPFVEVKNEKGMITRPSSAYLPVHITNPHSGVDIVAYALIDTGADFSVFPSSLAAQLKHDVHNHAVYTREATGISGEATLYLHTFSLEILMPNRQDIVHSFEPSLIRCSDEDIPPLLGVQDCLKLFKLSIDYPQALTTLTN